MPFQTELHMHTSEVSSCSHQTASEAAEDYIKAGFHTVVITNHYTCSNMPSFGDTWEERIERFLSPVRLMKEAAGDRLNVLIGCELRFPNNINDYLIFGITEDFLREHPMLCEMKLRTFSELARENDLLVIQAHPFRCGMTIADIKYLDGIEVYNGHAGHDSRNPIADMWSKRYGLLRTSGSDHHNPDSEISGGIITDVPVTSEKQLAQILRSGDYTLRCAGTWAQRDGMSNMPARIPKDAGREA